ncbi:MAG: PRK06851 family protein [Patescibacteria group bacterium]
MEALRGGHVRRLFPGGNTAYGFHSFYDQIIAPDATRIFIIKGGPGVGKATFMRAIAEEMAARGFAVELMQCSSDNDSLDGAVFPGIGVALIDGTAPHVVDPKNPGCVDEIVHLGDFWDEAGMVRGKAEILALNQRVGALFARAYRFLRAAKAIRDDWSAANAARLDAGRANRLADEMIHRFLGPRAVAASPGGIRRLFASAITPEGPVNHLETIFSRGQIVVLRGDPGSGRSTLLGKVAQAAAERGLAVECFMCGFDPLRLEHIYLPGLQVGFVTSGEYHRYGEDRAETILDMDDCRGGGTESIAIEDRGVFAGLLGRAVACIREAKETHDLMESHYIPHMDFAAINRLRERILRRILAYAGAPGAEPGCHSAAGGA